MAEVRVETILPLLENVSDMSGKAFTVYNKITGVAHGLDGQVLIDLDVSKVDKVAGSRLINTEEISKLEDTSGTNTGDETKNSIEIKLGAATASNDGFLKKEDFSIFTAKEDAANKSNDVIADGSSTTKFPTVKSIKDYADGLVVGLLDDRGSYDASSNQWPTTGGSGTGGAVLKGDLWYISVEGTLGGVLAKVGYSIRALMDNPGQNSSKWDMMNTGIGYVPENIAHKTTVINSSSTDVEYPTAKAVNTELEKKINKDGSNSLISELTFVGINAEEEEVPLKLRFNVDDGTFEFELLNGVVGQVFQELFFHAKVTEDIVEGDLIQYAGAQGRHALVKKSVGSELRVNPYLFMGVATSNGMANDFIKVTWFGNVKNIDTTGLSLGDILYADTSNGIHGKFTNVQPLAPNPKINVGVVTLLATGGLNNGEILVRPSFHGKMMDNDDVLSAAPTEGQVLRFTSSNRFELFDLDGVLGLKADKYYVDEEQEEIEEVTAQSLVELREEVRSLKALFSDMLLTYAKIATLDVTTYRKDGAPLFIISDVVPAVVPDFIGQIYIKNTATVGAWIATGDTAISNWKEI